MDPVKFTAAADVLLHSTWLATAFTVGVGFTVIIKVIGVPVQLTPALVYVGITVTVALIGAIVVFVAMKPGILPDPFNPNPIAVLLLLQLYTMVPPVAGLVKFTAAVAVPLQTV